LLLLLVVLLLPVTKAYESVDSFVRVVLLEMTAAALPSCSLDSLPLNETAQYEKNMRGDSLKKFFIS
jgi:hypothetical protein